MQQDLISELGGIVTDFARDPEDTIKVYHMSDAIIAGLSEAESVRLEAELLRDEGFAAMWRERDEDESLVRTPYDVERLAALPEDTLGGVYGRYMRERGLDPEFYPPSPATRPLRFHRVRSSKTHDLHHVVTGFGTDVVGEMGLQAFYLGQLPLLNPLSILASGFLWAVGTKDPEVGRSLMEAVTKGYEAGRRAKPFHGVRWERHLEEPLAEVRAQLLA